VSILLAALSALALTLALSVSLAARIRALNRLVASRDHRLSDQQRRLDAVLDASSDGIILASADGIELMNPAAEVIFGRLREDMLGASLDEFMPELMDADRARPPSAHAGEDRPRVHDIRIPHADGQRFPARVWLRHLQLDDGMRRLLVIQDLTESAHQAQQLEFLDQRDVITGLLNRKEFERRMERMLIDASGTGRPMCSAISISITSNWSTIPPGTRPATR
jgi:PAS domain S-box-containing protein